MYQSILTASRPDSILSADGFKELGHSLSLVSATTEMIYSKNKNFDFFNSLWSIKLEPYAAGYFEPYYDGLLHLFSLMHLRGKYQLIKPGKH